MLLYKQLLLMTFGTTLVLNLQRLCGDDHIYSEWVRIMKELSKILLITDGWYCNSVLSTGYILSLHHRWAAL